MKKALWEMWPNKYSVSENVFFLEYYRKFTSVMYMRLQSL